MRAKFLLLASLLMLTPVHAESRLDIGGTLVDGNLRNFYVAIGEYYRMPEREVVIIRERRIPDYEVPVVLHIAERAHVEPGMIIDMRLRGRSWMDITLHFGLGPDIYYVPVRKVYGPPYGHAYGHYKNKQRDEWKHVRLDDDDVVNLVNLRFISDRYKYAPEDVMRMRSGGKNFVVINEEIRKGKKEKKYRDDDRGYGKDKGKNDKNKGRKDRQDR